VSDPDYNNPERALGAPIGGGTEFGEPSSIVTLGGAGGSITLGFDHRVMDDGTNPFGMDAIVYGNAFWFQGNPTRRFAEAGIIEISRDDNGNGLADDDWYFIPGSHLSPPCSGACQLPAGTFGNSTLNHPGGSGATVEVAYGYADMSPTLLLGDLDADNQVDDTTLTPEEFYTVPDDPMTVGMSEGAGGGDAFDIAWAVDPETGDPAGLDGFDFIRITTGLDASTIFGEISPEIDAVADVDSDCLADINGDGASSPADFTAWLAYFNDPSLPGSERADLNKDGTIGPQDYTLWLAATQKGCG